MFNENVPERVAKVKVPHAYGIDYNCWHDYAKAKYPGYDPLVTSAIYFLWKSEDHHFVECYQNRAHVIYFPMRF